MMAKADMMVRYNHLFEMARIYTGCKDPLPPPTKWPSHLQRDVNSRRNSHWYSISRKALINGRESSLIPTLRSENLADVSTECFSLRQSESEALMADECLLS